MNLYDYAELLMHTKKDQCYHRLIEGDKCCALGLIMVEATKIKSLYNTQDLTINFLCVTNKRVTYFNDDEKWSFARIGEYLLCCLLPM